MTDESDTNATRGQDGSEAQAGDPFRLYVGTQGGETFDSSEVFAVFDLAGGDDRATHEGGDRAFLLGGSGDDYLEGNGSDCVMGGSGDDTINAVGRRVIVRAGTGDDNILGTSGNDWLLGDAGNDFINASGGNDFVAGGDGNDRLYGGSGNDWIIGGAGDDGMSGGDGRDIFHFHALNGHDTIYDFQGHEDIIDLRGFEVRITWAELSARIATAENGHDTVIDLSDWGGGTITLHHVRAEYLSEDMFYLPDPRTPLVGGDEEEGFYVPGTATYIGSAHADVLVADGRANIIFGGEGDDTLDGGGGGDWIFGGEGDDRLYGNRGNDRLMGGEGRDTLHGGEGDDWLSGGAGRDELTGGAGADTFAFFADHGSDTITDFTNGEDKIDLRALESILGFEDLSVIQRGTLVTIDLHGHGGGTISLEGFDIDDLDETDFVFYQPPQPVADAM